MRDFKHSLPTELLKAREAAMARFRPMLRDHGLTEQQWRVVRALSEFDKIDAGELAQRSFLLAPSLTRILRFLEREDIVRRFTDKNDQRRTVLGLTNKGKEIHSQVGPDSEALYIEIEQDFGLENMEALYSLLANFYSALGKTADRASGPAAKRDSGPD